MTPVAADVSAYLARRARWSPLEIAFWVFAFATIWLFPGKHLILTETAILALFALSLDLILGYAGIISLGQAAFFGFAGYFAGLIAKYGIVNEPVIALVLSGLVAAALGFVTSFLVLRGSDLTRLMVTLGVALMLGEIANRFSNITGGADGLQGVTIAPILGLFRFDMFGHTGYIYCLIVLFICFLYRAAYRVFAVRLVAALAEGNTHARRPRSAFRSIAGWWRSTRFPPASPALPAGCSPRPRRSARSMFFRLIAPPISSSSSLSAAPAICMAD